jgi:Phage P22-like portal protein
MARKAEKIAHEARLACEKWREYFKQNIDMYHTMHTFVLGQQWTDDEEELLKTFKKVPMVANKLATMANQLLGEQQQNTPQLQVVPLSNCSQEVAHLRELIVKDIIFSTDAHTVYQVAASQSFIGGFGAFLWDTDYAHRRSFDLDIIPRHFKDASRCYWDNGADEINKTDGEQCGYITRMTRPKFRQVYGKDLEEKISKTMSPTQTKEEIALATQPSEGDDPFSWADNEGITIIDHYKRKYVKSMLYKLSNGNTYDQEELDELIEQSREIQEQKHNEQMLAMVGMGQGMGQQMPQQMGMMDMQQMGQGMPMEMQSDDTGSGMSDDEPVDAMTQVQDGYDDIMTIWDDGEPVRIEEKREIKKHKIMHYKIAGDYVLEEEEFPSEQLPLVFVDQNSYYDKNGKQICRSFFGDCKDTQRYINYLRTQSAFVLKVSRYDQFIGSKKNVAGLDTQRNWKDPGSFQGLLAYDESPNGHKPEQIMPPELSQSLLTQYQLALEDLYTSTGLYPSRMGAQGNEVSGAAIDARTKQGSYSTFVAYNSINRAIGIGGEIVNEMIPRVYDAQRVIALMTPDEGMKNYTINKQSDEYGAQIENDIRKGSYEVRLKPGPSFEGQKEMALNSLNQVLQASPEAFQLVADLYADNLPLANTIEIKNRLKTLVPPQIIEAGKTGKMPNESGQPSPQEQAMQAQMQMQQQEMQLKAKEVELKEKELELKKQEIIMEAQAKLQELENDRLETAAKIKEQEMRYLAETDRTESDTMISHSDNLVKILTHKVG